MNIEIAHFLYRKGVSLEEIGARMGGISTNQVIEHFNFNGINVGVKVCNHGHEISGRNAIPSSHKRKDGIHQKVCRKCLYASQKKYRDNRKNANISTVS